MGLTIGCFNRDPNGEFYSVTFYFYDGRSAAKLLGISYFSLVLFVKLGYITGNPGRHGGPTIRVEEVTRILTERGVPANNPKDPCELRRWNNR